MGLYARSTCDEKGRRIGDGELSFKIESGYNKNPVDPFDVKEDEVVPPSKGKAAPNMSGVLSGFLVKDYRVYHMLIHHLINMGVSPLAQCRLFRAGRYKGIVLAAGGKEFRADGYRVYTRNHHHG